MFYGGLLPGRRGGIQDVPAGITQFRFYSSSVQWTMEAFNIHIKQDEVLIGSDCMTLILMLWILSDLEIWRLTAYSQGSGCLEFNVPSLAAFMKPYFTYCKIWLRAAGDGTLNSRQPEPCVLLTNLCHMDGRTGAFLELKSEPKNLCVRFKFRMNKQTFIIYWAQSGQRLGERQGWWWWGREEGGWLLKSLQEAGRRWRRSQSFGFEHVTDFCT